MGISLSRVFLPAFGKCQLAIATRLSAGAGPVVNTKTTHGRGYLVSAKGFFQLHPPLADARPPLRTLPPPTRPCANQTRLRQAIPPSAPSSNRSVDSNPLSTDQAITTRMFQCDCSFMADPYGEVGCRIPGAMTSTQCCAETFKQSFSCWRQLVPQAMIVSPRATASRTAGNNRSSPICRDNA